MRRLVMTLQQVFLEDRASYTADDVGRVFFGSVICLSLYFDTTTHSFVTQDCSRCYYMRESLPEEDLEGSEDLQQSVFHFDVEVFIDELLRKPFAHLPFTPFFCLSISEGLATAREGDALFQHTVKHFCEGLTAASNARLSAIVSGILVIADVCPEV